MAIEILILAAALGMGDACCSHCGHGVGSRGVYASLATHERQIEENGRPWHGLTIANVPMERVSNRAHAAASYGATPQAGTDAVVVVDGLFPFEGGVKVAVNPWEVVSADRGANHTTNPYRSARRKAAERVEQARLEWLKDQGYVGGVRTFTPDHVAPRPRAEEIQPRGVIELSPEVTEFRSRMQVNAQPAGPTRVSRDRAVIRVIPATPSVADTPAPNKAPAAPVANARPDEDKPIGA